MNLRNLEFLNDQDWKQLCINFSKQYPEEFINTLEYNDILINDDQITNIINFIACNKKIQAIKMVRFMIKIGLHDAKTIVDEIDSNIKSGGDLKFNAHLKLKTLINEYKCKDIIL